MLVKVIDPMKEQDYYCDFKQASRLLSVGIARVHQLYPYTLTLKTAYAAEGVESVIAPKNLLDGEAKDYTDPSLKGLHNISKTPSIEEKVIIDECFNIS